MSNHEVPARPDACYARLIELGSTVLGSVPTARAAIELASEAGAVIHYLGSGAIHDSDRGLILFGGPAPPEVISDILAESVAGGGLFNGIIWRILEEFIRSRATDPANLDYARSWLAAWLRGNG